MQATAKTDKVMNLDERRALIAQIRNFPPMLRVLVQPLSDMDLYTAYLPGEWTVAQNIHHLADVHMNSYVRMKLMLTEDTPMIKPYEQDDWAVTPDAQSAPIADSLLILDGLHPRWAHLLEWAEDRDWSAVHGNHLELGLVTLADMVRYYAGHGQLHIDQINKTLAAK
ncbi:MAG: DinB family protein [Anaerolineae bacterium]|nr:DinB family protein [Anaerolineae bacterium]